MKTLYFSMVCMLLCRFLIASDSLKPQAYLAIEALPPSCINWLAKKRVGLMSNHTSRDRSGKRTVDILLGHGIYVAYIFAPEHGFDGTLAAGHDVHTMHDAQTGIPVMSTYTTGNKNSGIDRVLKELDVLIFDMQDSGMRHYTYISTLFYMLQLAYHHKIACMVFDRPNPLGPRIEGPIGTLLPLPNSNIPPIQLPLRHGLTVGQLARYFNRHALADGADVHVVPMKQYVPTMANPPIASYALSPNIQSKNACHGYSFLGLLGEVRPFDVGIGTGMAFQCITLPEDIPCSTSTWKSAASLLQAHGVTTSPYRYYSTRKKKWCRGLSLIIPDCIHLDAFTLFMHLVLLFKKACIPIAFSPGFDHASGNLEVRAVFEGKLPIEKFFEDNERALQNFSMQIK